MELRGVRVFVCMYAYYVYVCVMKMWAGGEGRVTDIWPAFVWGKGPEGRGGEEDFGAQNP